MTCKLKTFLLLLRLFVLAFFFHTNPCSAGGRGVLCLDEERQALLRFKEGLIVPSNRLSSWNASHADCCIWPEVVCDNLTGHVTELYLANPYNEVFDYKDFESYKLQGKVNPSLLDLKYLHYLNLSYNDFGGVPIPSFFGSLARLAYLDLSQAGFEGLIPYQLGNLSNLRYLSIEDNFESYVDNLRWLRGLTSLEHLNFGEVDLSAASHEWLGILNSFPYLQKLHLSGCRLAFIPSLSTANFTSLSVLDISANDFNTSIPKWMLSLSQLKSLDLSSNYFSGPIPDSFSNLTSLTILDLSDNSLTSPLPNWLFGLNGLVSLFLSDNNFRDPVPASFQNFTSLRQLGLSHVDFSNSSIPEWVYKFSHLENLQLRSANLSGKISSAIQNMTSLQKLDLSLNDLEGTIPRTMRSLCNLKEIDLSDNKLGGELSKAIESLSGCSSMNLEYISLGQNEFSGNLADEIRKLGSLQLLDIGFNMLEGIVTEVHFTNLSHLSFLNASGNNLTLRFSPNWVPPFRLTALVLGGLNIGPRFPSWLQNQHALRVLDLSCSGISDSIPPWFWNLTSQIFYLNLSHNQIHGELPRHLKFEASFIYLSSNKLGGQLPQISTNVTELDLSKNSFSGSISFLLCHPTAQRNKLLILNLGKNHLSGEIPDCWMNWKFLAYINLENNNLTGKIPSSMAHLSNLHSLHLRNNNLVGDIPASLKNCTHLVALDLGLNNFVGKIPEWLGSFRNLTVLGLSKNKLGGEIPSELCYLISLQILDLSENNLSGSVPTCVKNLTAMTIVQSSGHIIYYSFQYYASLYDSFQYYYFQLWYEESASVVTKGIEVQYDNTLPFAVVMDMSGNKLSGSIPREITALLGLHSLNLSRNNLTGEIPINIGDMQQLESVDLSWNQISGRIPPSMSNMHFLCYLNVSYNNLSGAIPQSTQLQSQSSSSFVGNKLCGPPLTKSCSGPAIPAEASDGSDKKGEGTKVDEFYIGMLVGLVVGFWGIIGPLLYCRSWRISYFRFLNEVWCRCCGIFGN